MLCFWLKLIMYWRYSLGCDCYVETYCSYPVMIQCVIKYDVNKAVANRCTRGRVTYRGAQKSDLTFFYLTLLFNNNEWKQCYNKCSNMFNLRLQNAILILKFIIKFVIKIFVIKIKIKLTEMFTSGLRLLDRTVGCVKETEAIQIHFYLSCFKW